MNYYDQLEEKLIKLFPHASPIQIEHAVEIIDLKLEPYPISSITDIIDNKPIKVITIKFNCGYVGPDKIKVVTQEISFSYQLLKLPY
jgi:hypothetical protein